MFCSSLCLENLDKTEVFVPNFGWIVFISTMFLNSLFCLSVEIRLSQQLQINSNQGGRKYSQ